jgi:N-acetylglucosamine malate deacetylase 1
MQHDRPTKAAMRRQESIEACKVVGATYHESICNDMEVYYTPENLAKVCSVVRRADPTIVLTHAPVDYMEDHETSCRLAVSASFVKGMPNYRCYSDCLAVDRPVAIYHAQPHGNCTPLGEPVVPDFFVNIESVIERKIQMLACHQSQSSWLDSTQKMNSYLDTMVEMGRTLGKLSKVCNVAEGFRRHLHLGFSQPDFDPLTDALQSFIVSRAK